MNTNVSYRWKGLNDRGQRVSGIIDAENSHEAQIELKKNGIELISLEISKPIFSRKKNTGVSRKIKSIEIILFTRFLSTMIAAGLPIVQALDIIGHDQENSSMKNLVLKIRTNIEAGKTLSEAFNEYPTQFSSLYRNLISAGEKSGTLDVILSRLANYLEKSDRLRRKVKKALIYPAAIFIITVFVSLILLIFVVPQFEKLFSTFGAQLPLFTRMVLNVSNFVRDYWWFLIIFFAGTIWTLKRIFKKSKYIQELLDGLFLKLYIIGHIVKNSIIARYTRTLATTLDAGIPIVESMRSLAPLMNNKIYSDAILKITHDVGVGYQLSVAMRTTKLFPNMVVQMISIGETSGTLPLMLNKIADFYEEEVNTTVDNLSTLLEPIIMLILGIIVGGFVVAMYLPIFKLGSVF